MSDFMIKTTDMPNKTFNSVCKNVLLFFNFLLFVGGSFFPDGYVLGTSREKRFYEAGNAPATPCGLAHVHGRRVTYQKVTSLLVCRL